MFSSIVAWTARYDSSFRKCCAAPAFRLKKVELVVSRLELDARAGVRDVAAFAFRADVAFSS